MFKFTQNGLRVYEKHELKIFLKKFEKVLAFCFDIVYSIPCCDMIAKKREVAVMEKSIAGFPWSECQV